LWPPWKRTTAFTWSVKRSTTLPLPSSPHCKPITTRFLPITRHPQQCQSRHHADQPSPSQLLRFGLGELRHQPLGGHRVDERQHTLEDQVQRKGAGQIARELAPSYFHHFGGGCGCDLLKYLKYALSGAITSTSPWVPTASRYDSMLR